MCSYTGNTTSEWLRAPLGRFPTKMSVQIILWLFKGRGGCILRYCRVTFVRLRWRTVCTSKHLSIQHTHISCVLTLGADGSLQNTPRTCNWPHASPTCRFWCTAEAEIEERGEEWFQQEQMCSCTRSRHTHTYTGSGFYTWKSHGVSNSHLETIFISRTFLGWMLLFFFFLDRTLHLDVVSADVMLV